MDQSRTVCLSNSRRFAPFALSILFFVATLAASGQASLTLRQAIDHALRQSPQVAIARADDQGAKSAATIARTQLLPHINFTEDISRGNDPVYVFGAHLRQGQFTQADFALDALNHPEPLGNFSTRLSGTWIAFDSFKTQREIQRADLLQASASSSAKAVDQQIILNVVGAYQSVLYAQREIEVAQHEQETALALLAWVDNHVRAGLAVEADRISTQVNVAARKQELIAAQGDLNLAWAQLREAIGVPDLEASELKPIEPHTFPQLSLEQELATAAKTRPDLTALAKAQSAQREGLRAAKSKFGPVVSTYGNWEEDRGSPGGSGSNSWIAGIQISVDLLPLGTRAQLAKETATKQKLDAQLSASQQHMRLEVSQAHIRRRTAELTLQTALAAIDQSAESLRILKNRYAAGLANITDLLRAEDAERQSQSNYWHAVYGNTMSYAELLYATGTLTPAAAEDLQ
jgi:outer membrane protein TolC